MGRIKSTSKTDFYTALKENNQSYFKYFTQLSNIAISRFKWTGLPDSIDTRFLEFILYFNGTALIFEDEELGFLCTRWSADMELNVYDIPTGRHAYANNGYNNRLNQHNSVVLYNNMLRIPTSGFIDYQARRLYDYDTAIDVNASAQKTPILLRCQKHMLLSIKNLYAKFKGNEPVIYGDDELDPNTLTVLKTDAPFTADKLQSLKSAVWNETLTYLGIPNVTYQKTERMITDEVARMQGGTMASVESELAMRKQAVEELKRKFPGAFMNADVEFKFTSKEGEKNVDLYGKSERDM